MESCKLSILELANKLCKNNKLFSISHISDSTNSIYMIYTYNKVKYRIRVSDHLKKSGNNYFDVQIILENNYYKLYYSKYDYRYRSIQFDK